MIHHLEFQRTNVVDVSAAVVGISRKQWVSHSPGDSREETKHIMARRRFDVMPIEPESNEPFSEYFVTSHWGEYKEIERKSLSYGDVIRYDAPMGEVLARFQAEDQNHLFLEKRGRVVGLVTVGNLNSRMARVYFYDLICEFERRAGVLVADSFDYDSALLAYTNDHAGGDRGIGKFEDHKEEGAAANLVHYLGFGTLMELLQELHTDNDKRLELTDEALHRLDRAVDIKNLRNQVMHAVQDIDAPRFSRGWLVSRLEDIGELNFHLNRVAQEMGIESPHVEQLSGEYQPEPETDEK